MAMAARCTPGNVVPGSAPAMASHYARGARRELQFPAPPPTPRQGCREAAPSWRIRRRRREAARPSPARGSRGPPGGGSASRLCSTAACGSACRTGGPWWAPSCAPTARATSSWARRRSSSRPQTRSRAANPECWGWPWSPGTTSCPSRWSPPTPEGPPKPARGPPELHGPPGGTPEHLRDPKTPGWTLEHLDGPRNT